MDRREILKGAVKGLILAAMGKAVFAAENANQHVATHDNINSMTTVQGKLKKSVSVKDFGAVGDGVTDDTAHIQAALDSGAKTVIGRSVDNYLIRSVTIPDGVTFDLNGATVTAGSGSTMIFTENNCTVKNGTIDGANTQGASTVNADGCPIGISMVGKSGLSVVNVAFTRFRYGIRATTNTAGVYCTGLYVSGCTFTGYVYPSTVPDSGQFCITVGSTVTANNTIIGTFSSSWAEALLTNAICIVGNRFYGGQYGIALHRCSDVVVSGNDIREASRGISIQVQSRDLSITGNTIADCHSAGIHMASGIRNCTVIGNTVTGTMANDNVAIQAYYGCQDITIANNTLDSRFDQWAGGIMGDARVPNFGIRIGQMTKNIKITSNMIRGFAFGIAAYTTIYPLIIPPSNSNYQNTGLRSIEIAGNKIIFDYEVLRATTYRKQFLRSNSYGIFISKSGAWESYALGGLGLDKISVHQNECFNTNYPVVWQYVTDTSGRPVVKQKLNSKMNIASSSVGNHSELYVGSVSKADVNSVGNSWADSNH